MRNGTKETAPLSTSPAPYFRGEIVIVNAPKHEAHGYRVRIVKRTPRTVGEPGDVYKVRLASPVSDDANPRPIPRGLYFFDTEELKPAGCEECNYRGWIEMYDVADATDEDDRKRIERDDNCGVFASDDEAIAAAIKDGYTPQGCLGCFSPRCIACGYLDRSSGGGQCLRPPALPANWSASANVRRTLPSSARRASSGCC